LAPLNRKKAIAIATTATIITVGIQIAEPGVLEEGVEVEFPREELVGLR
jgi:hypothetical protein